MIEFVTGCMFCGKTEELIRRLRRENIACKKVILFKPKLDSRYSEDSVKTHDGISFDSINIENSDELYSYLDYDVIGIDEVQFFDESVITFCRKFGENKLIVVSGLNMDFRGEPFRFRDSFKHVGELLALSRVTYLTAVCTCEENGEICGREAEFSQRLINGKPASYDDKLVVVGGRETYEARCKKHHFVTGKKIV